MKRLFPTSLFVLAGMLLQLVGCKDDEVSLPDEVSMSLSRCRFNWTTIIISNSAFIAPER